MIVREFLHQRHSFKWHFLTKFRNITHVWKFLYFLPPKFCKWGRKGLKFWESLAWISSTLSRKYQSKDYGAISNIIILSFCQFSSQIFVQVIHPCIVYWGTTKFLKEISCWKKSKPKRPFFLTFSCNYWRQKTFEVPP